MRRQRRGRNPQHELVVAEQIAHGWPTRRNRRRLHRARLMYAERVAPSFTSGD